MGKEIWIEEVTLEERKELEGMLKTAPLVRPRSFVFSNNPDINVIALFFKTEDGKVIHFTIEGEIWARFTSLVSTELLKKIQSQIETPKDVVVQ